MEQNQSTILNLLNSSDFFERLKPNNNTFRLMDELSGLEARLKEKLKDIDGLEQIFENYTECCAKVYLDDEDNAVVSAFKLGLKIGMEI